MAIGEDLTAKHGNEMMKGGEWGVGECGCEKRCK